MHSHLIIIFIFAYDDETYRQLILLRIYCDERMHGVKTVFTELLICWIFIYTKKEETTGPNRISIPEMCLLGIRCH